MKFIQSRMPLGTVDPSHWVSECGCFSIQRYTYAQKWHGVGRRKKWVQVNPYYQAYRTCDGKRLHTMDTRFTFEQAVERCENYSWKGEKS